MKKALLFCLMGMLIVSMILAGCAKSTTTTKSKEPIKIGVLFGITGFMAPIADEVVKAAELAVEQLGSELAGRPVELIIEDTASDPATAVDKARKLVEQDKVSMILGPLHGASADAVVAYNENAHVPELLPFAEPVTLSDYHWGWAFDGSTIMPGYPMGEYVYDKLGYRSCSILCTDRSSGHDMVSGFKQTFGERGGTVLQEQYFPDGATEFTSYIANLNKNVDCLLTWVADGSEFAFFPQYKQSGINIPIVQVEHGGVILSPQANVQIGESLVGIVTLTQWVYTLNTTGNKNFVDAYKAKYGITPGPFAGNTMSAMQIFYDAVKRTGGDTSPDKLAAALNATKLDTVCGHIEFVNRAAITPLHIVQIGPMPDLAPEVLQTVMTSISFKDKQPIITFK